MTTVREKNLVSRVMKSPMSFMKTIGPELLRKGCEVSHMTVFRRLTEEFNLKSHKPSKKPRFAPAMKTN